MKNKLPSQEDIDFFFESLATLYPENKTELNRNTPRQLLVAVVLSAQTTDQQVNKVTQAIFKEILTPFDTLLLTQEDRYQSLKSVNYAPTKAKHLYQTAQILTSGKNNPDYCIPKDLKKLMSLPGVGEKTAKVIRHVLYHTNDIAVDTHVHRVLNRLGFVHTSSPAQTAKLVDKVIPDRYKSTAHYSLVMFGRYHYQARNPRFKGNSLGEFREYYNNLTTT